ncbi:MAG: hypothetical protein NWE94_07615 [Candidatus Bathyarchaeota archaeon]|nr:hypothetical protein [Candidatus Bathyarchaeota archaeon]
MEKDAKDAAEDKKIIKVRIQKNPEPAMTLFSQDDITKFVKEFISAWIRGDITIRFPTAAELSKKTPLSIAFPVDPSVNAELKIKEHYVDLLSICTGTKQATAREQEKAVAEVFRMLLMFRSANRIEGKILSSDLEKRITQLEKTAESTSKLVEQITAFLFKEKKKPRKQVLPSKKG